MYKILYKRKKSFVIIAKNNTMIYKLWQRREIYIYIIGEFCAQSFFSSTQTSARKMKQSIWWRTVRKKCEGDNLLEIATIPLESSSRLSRQNSVLVWRVRRKKSDDIAETMPRAMAASSFDHKAKIEECADPSAVNFRVLSSREMRECSPVQGVPFVTIHSILWIFWRKTKINFHFI